MHVLSKWEWIEYKMHIIVILWKSLTKYGRHNKLQPKINQSIDSNNLAVTCWYIHCLKQLEKTKQIQTLDSIHSYSLASLCHRWHCSFSKSSPIASHRIVLPHPRDQEFNSIQFSSVQFNSIQFNSFRTFSFTFSFWKKLKKINRQGKSINPPNQSQTKKSSHSLSRRFFPKLTLLQ